MKRGSPYPIELRERVIKLWQAGRQWEELAEIFQIGVATVNRWVGRYRQTGTANPLPHGGGQPLRTDDAVVSKLVAAAPDRTRAEVAAAYAEATGVTLSVATIGRALQRLGFTRKKSRWSRPSEIAPRSSPRGKRSAKRSTRSRPAASSSSTRPARTSR